MNGLPSTVLDFVERTASARDSHILCPFTLLRYLGYELDTLNISCLIFTFFLTNLVQFTGVGRLSLPSEVKTKIRQRNSCLFSDCSQFGFGSHGGYGSVSANSASYNPCVVQCQSPTGLTWSAAKPWGSPCILHGEYVRTVQPSRS